MRYIIGISNVLSRGERCMVILMIVLVILVMIISDRASDMQKTSTGGTNSGGDEGM